MRITVTGAAGFIGQHIVPELTEHGHHVTGFDRRDGDLTQAGVASYLIHRSSPDVVLHLAAQVGRQFGEIDPAFTIASNVTATALVAKACHDVGAHLVYLSSSEVYGDLDGASVDEDSVPALPYNLYGLTKRQGEEVARLYCNTTVVRLAMPYGPGLPPGKGRAAIVNFLYAAHKGQEITVHRGAERCWCWIGDTTRGLRLIIETGRWHMNPSIYNLGRDDNPTSMYDVAMLACSITKSQSVTVAEHRHGAEYGDTRIRLIDPPDDQVLVKRLRTDRLRSLGWKPEVDLEAGMELTYSSMRLLGHLA